MSCACVADDTTSPTIVRMSRARRKVTSVFSVMITPNQFNGSAEKLPRKSYWA